MINIFTSKALLGLVLICWANAGFAQALQINDIWRSTQLHYPAILEQQANQQVALQAQNAAQAAFDPVLSNSSYARASGFFNGRITDTQISKRLGVANARVYSGYRISRGDFPIYEDILFTNSGGEVKFGVEFSLLRDRAVDPARFAIQAAKIERANADLAVQFTRVQVQRQATRAYKRWLAAGFRLRIYENLLAIAQQRDSALSQRVAEGDAAPILKVENLRNLIRRQELVNDALLQLADAAQALSLYWRDNQGQPQLPLAQQLPANWTTPNPIATEDLETLLEMTLATRPDINRLNNDIAKESQRLKLERNRLAPKLDVGLEVSNDFGSGSQTRADTDTIFSLNFEVPIGLRAQKSKVRAAQAKIQSLQQQRRLATDSVRVALQQLLTQLQIYHQGIQLAVQAQEQNSLLETAEKKLFEEGASDFFLLNIREENTAEAQIRRINAKEQFFLTRTDFYAATVQLDALGLTDSSASATVTKDG